MSVRRGFRLCAAFNIVGILLFSRLFTNQVLFDTDPTLFAPAGCALIMVWGLAYVASIDVVEQAPTLAAVFALEKAIYLGLWVMWIAEHGQDLAALWAADAFAGFFYSVYGIGDGLCAVYFAWVFLSMRQSVPEATMSTRAVQDVSA